MSGAIEFKASAEGEKPVSFVAVEPMTGRQVLYVDPKYTAEEWKPTEITCQDVHGFVAAVEGVCQHRIGEVDRVFLSPGGKFVYLNGTPAQTTAVVRYEPKKSATCSMLCAAQGRTFGQRTLIQYGQQWPEVLTPLVTVPDGMTQADAESVAWQKIQVVSVAGSTALEASVGAGSGRLLVQKDDGVEAAGLPTFWRVRTPWFDGGAICEAIVRMDWRVPEMDTETGKVKGELEFLFSLWSPAASALEAAAMDDACERMRLALGEGYVVVRGSIAGW